MHGWLKFLGHRKEVRTIVCVFFFSCCDFGCLQVVAKQRGRIFDLIKCGGYLSLAYNFRPPHWRWVGEGEYLSFEFEGSFIPYHGVYHTSVRGKTSVWYRGVVRRICMQFKFQTGLVYDVIVGILTKTSLNHNSERITENRGCSMKRKVPKTVGWLALIRRTSQWVCLNCQR